MNDLGAPRGWYDDPTQRHQRRYFDGTTWTDHVANGTEVATDPMRPVTPSTPDRSFLDSLGRDATTRSAPDFPTAMGGIGGLIVGVGIVALISQSGEQVAIVLAGLVTFALALAIVLFVAPNVGFLTSPAVSVAVVGIFATAIGVIVSDDGSTGTDTPFHVLLLAGLLCVAVWGLPGFRGRPLLLGVALVVIPLALAGLVASGTSCESFESDCNPFESAAGSAGLSSGAGVVLAIIGCLMLLAVRKLDALDRPGLATTFAAACIINLVIGAFLLAVDLGSTGGPLLVALAGVALGVVGHLGERRGLTWTGAALAAGGVVVAVFDLVDTDSSTFGGIVAVLTGAIVIGAPYAVVSFTGDRRAGESDPAEE